MLDRPTVYVIDDEPEVRRSIRFLLSTQGYRIEDFASGESFLTLLTLTNPSCILLDVNLIGMSGLDLQEELISKPYCPPIIFMSGAASVPDVVASIRSGAVDFLEKPFDEELLLSRIAMATKLDQETRSALSQRLAVQARLETLSPRENQIMHLLVKGKTTKQIAGVLKISPKTVEIHRAHVLEKMNVESVLLLSQLFSLPVLPDVGKENP